MTKEYSEGCWISLIVRVAMASLFAAAAIPKWMGGPESMVEPFRAMFKESWFPRGLVDFPARILPSVETLLPIWLLTGRRLRDAWIVTALFLVSLAFGMAVAKQGDTAAHNYLLVLIACAGLYFSPDDKIGIDLLLKRRKK